MPLQLPPHVARLVEATDTDERDDVARRVQLLDIPVGPLLTEDARSYLEGLIGIQPVEQAIEVCDALVETPEWRFRKVEFDGLECGQLTEIPDLSNGLSPPTDAEQLLVRAWLASDELLDRNDQLRQNVAVFAWSPSATDHVKEIVRSLSGVQTTLGPNSVERTWKTASIIELRTNSRILGASDANLLRQMFAEAATEVRVKWRYLSLYRILEHGYIEGVFNELSNRFFSEPKEAVKSATNALGSEVEQLIRLVEAHRLQDYFDEVLRVNDDLVASQNQFAILVEREAAKRGFQASYKRGVAVCYQVRCAIVHAGSYSVMFDKTPGADYALVRHLPELERAVIGFLGIVPT
jgi:hypothetical protein